VQEATRSQIDTLVRQNRVVLFMKGSRHFPQCGFSATVTKILDGYVPKYETVNVLSSAEIRDGIKEYSSWPTIPQLYIDGKFVGGCDIVKELDATGELGKLLGSEKAPPPKTDPPVVKVTDEAKKAILDAQKEAGGDPLRVSIGPHHEYDLFFEPKQAGDVVVELPGQDGTITFVFDAESAPRAGELSISMVEGTGFRVDSSKAPPRPKSMSAAELKKALETDKTHVFLVDVRPEAERKIASISGHKPLEPSTIDDMAALASDVRVVVYCHHGQRSRSAAEQLVSRGIKNVFNLEGGVDAYSSVDPSVPRY
jgi:monothiol glutaredoxin